MAEKIKLHKTIYEKESFNKAISRQFNTFTQPTDEEAGDTVQELFRLYDKLYLEIPLDGAQSHTYLIQESSKLVALSTENLEIQPLLDEISDLRERLLLANQEIIDLQVNTDV